jgi:serine/threonine-protein kinase HipA
MAGRPSTKRRLEIFMNGEHVGYWQDTPHGGSRLAYAPSWLGSELRRPISLSLPLTIGERGLAGPAVTAYFDNLLPDSPAIRNRVASRHGAASSQAFDLLEKIGRDCVGAVQLLPQDSPAPEVRRIEGQALAEADIAARLDAAVSGPGLGVPAEDDLRLSIAGHRKKPLFCITTGAGNCHWAPRRRRTSSSSPWEKSAASVRTSPHRSKTNGCAAG